MHPTAEEELEQALEQLRELIEKCVKDGFVRAPSSELVSPQALPATATPHAQSLEWMHLPGKTLKEGAQEMKVKAVKRHSGKLISAADELGCHRNLLSGITET
jgi:hypothetical protein